MSKRIFNLVHAQARRGALEYIQQVPDGFVVTVAEPARNLTQNALLWALLTEVASQVEWYGSYLTPESWKAIFTAAQKKYKVVPGIDGGMVVLGQSTSTMSKAEFAELIELIQAFAAEHDVKFTEHA